MCFDMKNGKKKKIFQWGNPGERLSECVEGVEIYKINLKKITYLKSFMQRIIQKRILNSYGSVYWVYRRRYWNNKSLFNILPRCLFVVCFIFDCAAIDDKGNLIGS